MIRTWTKLVLVAAIFLFLSACSTLEERAAEGMEKAEEVFFSESVEANEKIENVQFFKPSNFKLSEESDAQNIILNNRGETFVLFVNPNEKSDSRLHYDLLMAKSEKILFEKTFEEKDRFGFVAVVQNAENVLEVITSSGGIKMSTLSDEENVEDHIETMMKVVNSVHVSKS